VKSVKKREVICFECHRSHEILADSTSALCPHCGAYIGLKHYDIRDQVNSRIQTRGDVFVHKKGVITGITIQCQNLTIEGEIQGGAECAGDFILRKTGKINGPVTADRVIVERRARVDFMSTVKAREVIIDGEVTGSVSCQKLTLKKRATLDGDLEVASLSVEEGARHTGNVKMKS
jgi:cytoskeletal protein CcmA (bactofilin family)